MKVIYYDMSLERRNKKRAAKMAVRTVLNGFQKLRAI